MDLVIRLDRRTFVQRLAVGVSLGGTALLGGCDLVGAAVRPKFARVGVLDSGIAGAHFWDLFRMELEQRGWREGQNLSIEWRFAGGPYDRLPALAAELVALPVDLIAAVDAACTAAAKAATSTIPIVMTSVGDPVGNGLVASLAHPGGNVTGVSNLTPRTAGKRLELLKEIAPTIRHVAVLGNASNPSTPLQFGEIQATATGLGVDVRLYVVRAVQDLYNAFTTAGGWPADSLLVLGDSFLNSVPKRVVDLAAQNRWPMMGARQFADAGGLMYYGPDALNQQRKAAIFVDKILRGENPADLPVEQPTVFELVINRTTAQRLGLTIPPELGAQVTTWVQ